MWSKTSGIRRFAFILSIPFLFSTGPQVHWSWLLVHGGESTRNPHQWFPFLKSHPQKCLQCLQPSQNLALASMHLALFLWTIMYQVCPSWSSKSWTWKAMKNTSEWPVLWKRQCVFGSSHIRRLDVYNLAISHSDLCQSCYYRRNNLLKENRNRIHLRLQ